jgi:hypothetical protein
MPDYIWAVLMVVGYLVLVGWILPKLGVPT